jgi:hypothetical protein
MPYAHSIKKRAYLYNFVLVVLDTLSSHFALFLSLAGTVKCAAYCLFV